MQRWTAQTRAEGGDGDEEDDELEDVEDVGETLGVVNELLDGGETSFLSRDPGGVVVSSSLPLTLLDTAVDYSVGVNSATF